MNKVYLLWFDESFEMAHRLEAIYADKALACAELLRIKDHADKAEWKTTLHGDKDYLNLNKSFMFHAYWIEEREIRTELLELPEYE